MYLNVKFVSMSIAPNGHLDFHYANRFYIHPTLQNNSGGI